MLPVLAGEGAVLVSGLAPLSSGDIFVAGSFTGSLDLDGGTYASAGGADAFVISLSGSSQELVWKQMITGAGEQRLSGLVTSFGGVLAAGSVEGVTELFGVELLADGEDGIVFK